MSKNNLKKRLLPHPSAKLDGNPFRGFCVILLSEVINPLMLDRLSVSRRKCPDPVVSQKHHQLWADRPPTQHRIHHHPVHAVWRSRGGHTCLHHVQRSDIYPGGGALNLDFVFKWFMGHQWCCGWIPCRLPLFKHSFILVWVVHPLVLQRSSLWGECPTWESWSLWAAQSDLGGRV